MTADYGRMAAAIAEAVGGGNNISSIEHCATRLRFSLKDSEKADTSKVRMVSGVAGVLERGGQFQVIIGTMVPEVYKAIQNILK